MIQTIGLRLGIVASFIAILYFLRDVYRFFAGFKREAPQTVPETAPNIPDEEPEPQLEYTWWDYLRLRMRAYIGVYAGFFVGMAYATYDPTTARTVRIFLEPLRPMFEFVSSLFGA